MRKTFKPAIRPGIFCDRARFASIQHRETNANNDQAEGGAAIVQNSVLLIVMAVAVASAIQQLNQEVGHRFGWSISFDKAGTSVVIISHRETYRFQGSNKETTAQTALKELEGVLQIEAAKEVRELHQVFQDRPIDIYESNEENWEYFWSHKPDVVGIDTEGNGVNPPLLVQIATYDYCILEVPINARLSSHLQMLLQDDTIVKVFCDNFSHKDKACLGLDVKSGNDSYLSGPIVDVECMAEKCFGPVSVARGLGKILDLVEPKDGVRIGKPRNLNECRRKQIGRYTWIEQGKAPRMQSVHELTNQERRYASLDAWCTLHAYDILRRTSTMPAAS
jgi:hypothetical protein